jgi:hypothetical protein
VRVRRRNGKGRRSAPTTLLLVLALLAVAAITGGLPPPAETTATHVYGPATRLAKLQDKAITESSGLAASRRGDDLFWTHNDSGDEPFLYAFDRAGKARATFVLTGATLIDWEDIAAGPGPGGPSLYIGDIGDNGRRRNDCVVYRVPEPVIGNAPPGEVQETRPAARFPFRYPDRPHDAETLMVHPRTGEVFIVTKGEKPPLVYRFPMPLTSGRHGTLERVATLPGISPFLTAGDIAPDGRRLVVRDYLVAFEYVLPPGKPFNAIFAQRPVTLALARERQGEAIAYRRDGRALLTTSEGRPTSLNEMLLLGR